jgi:hypothetical protein
MPSKGESTLFPSGCKGTIKAMAGLGLILFPSFPLFFFLSLSFPLLSFSFLFFNQLFDFVPNSAPFRSKSSLMIATKLYFDFSSPELFDSKFQSLTSELGDRGKLETSSSSYAPLISQGAIFSSAGSGISRKEIETWLEGLDLGEKAKKAFEAEKMLEPRSLAGLRDCWRQEQALAHQMAKEELMILTLGDRFRFFQELEKFLQ